MPLQLRVLVRVGIAGGCAALTQLRRRQGNLLVALLLGGRGLVLGLGHRQPRRRAVRDAALGGRGEALFLAGFACAAENAGDDLDAAETERGSSAVCWLFSGWAWGVSYLSSLAGMG